MLWISSATTKGGFPPFLGPYGAAKAAMDSLAVTLAYEIARFGIETSIVVPGAFTYPAGHASAGKWSSAAVTNKPCSLVTADHSYAMKIQRADFDAMLKQGLAFAPHLDAGRRYYSELFTAPAELVK